MSNRNIIFEYEITITLKKLTGIIKESNIDILNKIKQVIEENIWDKDDIIYFIESYIKEFDDNFEDVCKELMINED